LFLRKIRNFPKNALFLKKLRNSLKKIVLFHIFISPLPLCDVVSVQKQKDLEKSRFFLENLVAYFFRNQETFQKLLLISKNNFAPKTLVSYQNRFL